MQSKAQNRRSYKRRDQSHKDNNAKKLLVNDSCTKTDARNNKGNLSTRNHTRTNAETAFYIKAEQESGSAATKQLRADCNNCVNKTKEQDIFIKKLGNINAHTHNGKENRNKELVKPSDSLLNNRGNIRTRKSQSSSISTDNHRKAVHLKDSRQNQGNTESRNRKIKRAAKTAYKAGNFAGQQNEHNRRYEPDCKRPESDKTNSTARKRSATRQSSSNAHNNSKKDNSQNVVKNGSGKDCNTLWAVHFLFIAKNSGCNSYGRSSRHNSQEKTAGIHKSRMEYHH